MQSHTSKNTSVNSKKFPAIYSKLDLQVLRDDLYPLHKHYGYLTQIFDYGSGRPNQAIHDYLLAHNFGRICYDPYWITERVNTINILKRKDVIVCSNVLNVIKDNDVMNSIHSALHNSGIVYFITIYEGDKSGVGKESKADCWQRNQVIKSYLYPDEIIYKGVITKPMWKKYII